MYKQIFIFVGSVAFGWIAVGFFATESKVAKTGQNLPARPITLLGQTSRDHEELPEKIAFDGLSSAEELLAKIQSMSPDGLKRLLTSLANSPRPSYLAMDLIVARLASLDPEGTFTFLKTREDVFRGLWGTALAEWARSDLSAALEASFTVEPRGQILADFVHKLPGEQCEEVYQALLEMGFDKESPGFFANIVSSLSQNDPQLAAERALDLVGSYSEAHHAIENVMNRWYKEDPDGAILWIESLQDPNARRMAMETLAGVSLGAGIEGFERVWELLDEGQRDSLSGNINRHGHDVDIKALLEWADEKVQSPLQHQNILNRLMRSLPFSGEPEGLEEVLAHWEGDMESGELTEPIMQISQKWAEKDLVSFERWMGSIENAEIRAAAQNGLLEYWMNEDPDKAVVFWEQHYGESEVSGDKLDQTLGRLGISNLVNRLIDETGDTDLQALTERLPEAWHDKALEVYVSRFSQEAPAETLRLLEEMPEGEQRNSGLQISLGYWTTQDPIQAAEWVNGLPESEQRELAARNLANTWVRTDPQAAMAWLESQPASVSRDKAAEQIVPVAADYYPEMALPLLLGIGDQGVRERLLEETVSNLVRRDPDAAARYIESAGLGGGWDDRIESERALRQSFRETTEP